MLYVFTSQPPPYEIVLTTVFSTLLFDGSHMKDCYGFSCKQS